MLGGKPKVNQAVIPTSGPQEEPPNSSPHDLSVIRTPWTTSRKSSFWGITQSRIIAETKSNSLMSYFRKQTQTSREIYSISFSSNLKWSYFKLPQK
jgi:hypothetical protein